MALPYSPHVAEAPTHPSPPGLLRFLTGLSCVRDIGSRYSPPPYTALTDCPPFAYVYDPFRRGARDGQVFDNTSLPLARVGGRGKRLFQIRGTRLRVSRSLQGQGLSAGACHGEQGRRLPEHRGGPGLERQLRLPLDGKRRGLQGPPEDVRRRLLGLSFGGF